MTMRKLLLVGLIAAAVSGCASVKPLGESEDVWIADQSQFMGLGTYRIYYCQANKTKDGASPECREAIQKNSEGSKRSTVF